MARYAIYRLRSGRLVVDCQADVLSALPTRFVAPLVEPEEVPRLITRLHPRFTIDGHIRVMVTQEAAAILVSEIAEEIGSLIEHDTVIANALDMLIIGF